MFILLVLLFLLQCVDSFRLLYTRHVLKTPSLSTLHSFTLNRLPIINREVSLQNSMHLSLSSTTSSVETRPSPSIWDSYIKVSDGLTTLFPVWTVLSALLALKKPHLFNFFTTNYFTAALSVLMLSMGITLTPDDFTRVFNQPGTVFWGFLLCYVLCPLLGLGLGKAFRLPMDLVAGLVLVGSINGGQASNLCTYIAKGDVALSVLMTTVTTITGIIVTPILCKMILGAVVPLDTIGIASSCVQVILAPILIGMAANHMLPKTIEKLIPATPIIGMASTCLLVASAISQCAPAIVSSGIRLQLPIILLHFISGIAGYWIPRSLNFTEVQCRTMAIETAMKSSAFSFLLAKLHFSQYAARIPSAVSLVWMTLVGAIMAVVWRFIPIVDDKLTDKE